MNVTCANIAMAAACVALIAGCGGGGDADRPAAASATPAPAGDAPKAAARTARVAMKGFAFAPARATVATGGRVTWSDEDASNHTVTFADDAVRDVDNLRPGKRASVTFRKAGTYPYLCDFHPTMTGTVVVQ